MERNALKITAYSMKIASCPIDKDQMKCSTLHIILWPILIAVVLLAVEGKLHDTWHYEDFVRPWHTLWFLGMWLLGITPFLVIIAGVYLVKRAIKWATKST